MTTTNKKARVAVLAALLAGTAAMPAAAVTDARASDAVETEEDGTGPDWMLLAVASVTFLVGRGVAQRRGRSKPTS